jgi:hypothetical protein
MLIEKGLLHFEDKITDIIDLKGTDVRYNNCAFRHIQKNNWEGL